MNFEHKKEKINKFFEDHYLMPFPNII